MAGVLQPSMAFHTVGNFARISQRQKFRWLHGFPNRFLPSCTLNLRLSTRQSTPLSTLHLHFNLCLVIWRNSCNQWDWKLRVKKRREVTCVCISDDNFAAKKIYFFIEISIDMIFFYLFLIFKHLYLFENFIHLTFFH